MEFTGDQLRRVLHHLDERALRRMYRPVFGKTWDPQAIVPLREFLQLAIADWLRHLGSLVDDAYVLSILHQFQPTFDMWAEGLQLASNESEQPTVVLVISDGRWVSCTGRPDFWDMVESEAIFQLNHQAVTHYHCDVTALLARLRQRIRMMQNAATGKDAHEPADPQRPANDQPRPPRSLQDYAGGAAPVIPSDD